MIKKILYLPSGGMTYTPYIQISPIDNEFVVFEYDPAHSYDSGFEKIFAILNHYCELPTSIDKMLVFDVYYIWSYINQTYFKKGNDFIEINNICHHCSTKFKIGYELGNGQLNLFDKLRDEPITKITQELPDNIEITFKHRTVADNLYFAQYANTYAQSDFEYYIYYAISQIDLLYHNSEIVRPSNYYEFIKNNISLRSMFSIIEQLNKFNFYYGINNFIEYHCPKCKTKIYDSIYNDIGYNIVGGAGKISIKETEDMLKGLFELSRLPMFDYKQVLQFPYHLSDTLHQTLNNMKFQSGMIL